MSVILKLGAFDASAYVRLQPGDGSNPVPVYDEPQFALSPLREGGALIGHTTNLREMVWPLSIHAATKDAVNALEQSLVAECARADRTLEWRDGGSSSSTFYDVEAARFEPDFNYWRGVAGRLNGVLRVWVQPYGHTGTDRIVSVASTPVGSFQGNHFLYAPIASGALAGDVPADLGVRVKTDSSLSRKDVIVSVLANASYQPQYDATDFVDAMAGATLVTGQAGAPLGGYLAAPIPQVTGTAAIPFRVQLTIPTVYIGRNRIIAFARGQGFPAAGTVALHARDGVNAGTDKRLGPTQTIAPGASGWQPVDLGVLTVAYPGPVPHKLELYAGVTGNATATATRAFHVSDVFVVPEQTSVLASASSAAAGRYFHFDGYLGRTWLADTGDNYTDDLAGTQRGAMPVLSRDATGVAIVTANAGSTVTSADDTLSAEVRVRERFSFER